MRVVPSGRSRRRSGRGDRGESLIEVIIAVTIIALAVGPLLGALVEALNSSAEGRSLATIDTVLKGFAETATSKIQQSPTTPSPFNNCNGVVHYHVLSLPTPRVAAPGAAVTVFGTGFGSNLPITSFSVSVGGSSARILTNESQAVSGSEMGNMQVTFQVPALAAGTYPVTVSDGGGTTITSTAAADLTVKANGSTSQTSPLRGYTLGVTSVRFWSPGTPTESSPTTRPVCDGGIQLLTVHARAANGVSDTLTFALRNPNNVQIPVPNPAVVVSASPAFVALPASGSESLVFRATVTPAVNETRPTSTVTWTLKEGGQSSACASTAKTQGSGTNEIFTCTVSITPASPTGRYQATATYPSVATVNGASSGTTFATVYARNGSGIVTVKATPVTPLVKSSTKNTLTFTYTPTTAGMFAGEVTIKIPSTGGTPKKKWTPPKATSGPGYTVATIGSTPAQVLITPSTATTIVVTGVTLTKGDQLFVVYGENGGNTGVSAPSLPGTYTFVVKQTSVATPSPALATVGAPLHVKVAT